MVIICCVLLDMGVEEVGVSHQVSCRIELWHDHLVFKHPLAHTITEHKFSTNLLQHRVGLTLLTLCSVDYIL